jgi:hypothetical protein
MLNQRPFLGEERKTSARAECFSVGPTTDITVITSPFRTSRFSGYNLVLLGEAKMRRRVVSRGDNEITATGGPSSVLIDSISSRSSLHLMRLQQARRSRRCFRGQSLEQPWPERYFPEYDDHNLCGVPLVAGCCLKRGPCRLDDIRILRGPLEKRYDRTLERHA